MKRRSDVEQQYTWDLTILYKTHEEYVRDFEKVKTLCDKTLGFKGKLNSKEAILDEMQISSEIGRLLEKMEVWLMLRESIDGTDKSALEDIAELENYLNDYNVKASFIETEMAALDDDFLDELVADKRFENFDIELRQLKEDKKHILSEEKEQMLAKVGSFVGFKSLFDKLNDIEMTFGKIKLEDGSLVDLTNDNYNLYIHSKSQDVRRDAFLELHKGFKGKNLTISENFINFLKYCDVMAEFRNFESCFDSRLYSSRIKKSVVEGLVEKVNKHLGSAHSYLSTIQKKLGLEAMHNVDVYAPVGDSDTKVYDFDESARIVIQALEPLGEAYTTVVKTLMSNRSIDVFPTENKGSGAFSTGCYDAPPFILLNHNGTFNDVSTLAHEMGHSMHTYLSNKNQCFEKSGYDIFVAEIASTVNEILLFKHMEKHAVSDDEKKTYVANFLSTFYATVFRQTMFTEFELFAHGATKNKVPLTYDKLNVEYGKLQDKYFGKSVKLLENSNVEWSRIPHFYRPFYVFKYATGFVAACSIVMNILERGEEYVQHFYLKFLSAGCTKDPIQILKLADVDIESDETYKKAFDFFDAYVKIFDELN